MRFPRASSVPINEDISKIRRVIAERGLCGLANDTKWDEFLAAIRARRKDPDLWVPRYRCKCVDGLPTGWDGEWVYHLPFPFISVEWFDVEFVQKTFRGRLVAPLLTDHSVWITELLMRIGFEFQKGANFIRIFGYSPKNYDVFEPFDPGRSQSAQ